MIFDAAVFDATVPVNLRKIYPYLVEIIEVKLVSVVMCHIPIIVCCCDIFAVVGLQMGFKKSNTTCTRYSFSCELIFCVVSL